MEIEKIKSIIEAILFAAGRQVTIKELMISLEMPKEDLENIIVSMQEDYKNQRVIVFLPLMGFDEFLEVWTQA